MQISRIELYRLVSEVPLSKVAPRFGISGTALAAVCKKHNVPYPGSGHWTRKSLGLPVKLDALPEGAEPMGQIIEIEMAKPRTRVGSETIKDALSGAQSASDAELAATVVSPDVRERLTKPHPIIAKWLADHERRRKEAANSRDPWQRRFAPAPWSEIDRRRHRILDALFKALEARGAKISEVEKGLLQVTIDGEGIEFQVREKSKQVKVSADDKRSSYLSQELIGTGKLVFAIRTYLRGPHNEEWRETEKKPLESQLPKIVERLFEGAKILKAWKLEQDLERQQWRQEAARRAERERLLKQEEKRKERFVELAQDWKSAQLLRHFIESLKTQPFDLGTVIGEKTLGEWVAWAETSINALDPSLKGVEGLFAIIESVKVEKGWSL